MAPARGAIFGLVRGLDLHCFYSSDTHPSEISPGGQLPKNDRIPAETMTPRAKILVPENCDSGELPGVSSHRKSPSVSE